MLIVIIVVAVLSVIVVATYAGITKRAELSSASSIVSQAGRQLELYKVDNGVYPSLLIDASVEDGDGVTYQYTADDFSYCITATVGTTSVHKEDVGPTPVLGSCPGHT